MKSLADKNKSKSKWLPLIIVIATVALAGLVTLDYLRGSSEYTKNDIAMGSVVSQKLIGKQAPQAAQNIVDRISRIENNNLSMNVSSSDIYKVNTESGTLIEVSSETALWLGATLEVCRASNYALDITIGAVTKLWGIGSDTARVPTQSEIDDALKTVSAKNVYISGNRVRIPATQMLDMGAIGKGIACDEARKIARKHDLKRAVISVGGSIMLHGAGDFDVGIRNPSGDANDNLGIIKTKAACVSTSGNYEKVFTFEGKTYHHILSSQTGYPAESGLVSVTIVCDSGLLSDALSTACFVLGYESSLPLIEKYNAQAVFIFEDKSIAVTDGLKESFSLENDDYRLKAAI